MDREELLKLIADINSPDNLIRNFSANIFLNIKDDESIAFLYDAVKTANSYAKAMFIKLVASGKKKGRKKYLLGMMRDPEASIRAEAAAVIKKSAHMFAADDYISMLGSSCRAARLTALEMLAENPEEKLTGELIASFLASPPKNDELDLFESALKYICLHAKSDAGARLKYAALVMESFRTGRAEVLKSALKYAHFLSGEDALLEIYREFIFKRGENIDRAVIDSALNFSSAGAFDFLARFAADDSADGLLRRKCLVKLIDSGEPAHISNCLELIARGSDHALKFFCWNALQNIDRAKMTLILTGLINSAKSAHDKLEYLTLLSLLTVKNQRSADAALQIYAENSDRRIKAAALELIGRNNFKGLLPEDFLPGLVRSIFTRDFPDIKGAAIPLLVKYLPQGHMETLFAGCCNGARDYTLFCEAYIKRARGRSFPAADDAGEYKFYKRVIKSLFEYKDIDLIAAAAALATYKGLTDFIHEYARSVNLSRGGLYSRIIRKIIVSSLKSAPGAAKFFIENAREDDLILYVNLLKETSSVEALKAVANYFFGTDAGGGGRPQLNGAGENAHSGPLYYAVKDAVYFITKNNIDRVFEAARWPEFKNDNFITLMTGAFLSGLKEAALPGDSGFGAGAGVGRFTALYAKNPDLINFYKTISKKLGVEDKFSFYNILQKNGGETALEIISELG
jgi:hypothetical protein